MLPFPPARAPTLQRALATLASEDATERGAIFTRDEVVDAMLDLSEYTADRPLHRLRLLEPSFGAGDFLLPAVRRLLEAFRRHGGSPATALQLAPCVRAVEIHRASHDTTRDALITLLTTWGASPADAASLTQTWLVLDDFLLADLPTGFDLVVGNPPYVRQERIPDPLLAEYRRRFATIYDRADLYIPFYERGLRSLAPGGRLAFICANRWVKNKYGGPLRELIARDFHLRFYINMEGTHAFRSDVIAYPSITVIERKPSGPAADLTRIAARPEVTRASLGKLVSAMLNGGPASDARIEEVRHAVRPDDPWLLDEARQLRLVRDLEARFVELEAVGCRVGIGVATGLDRVFIGDFDQLPVEPERKLRLAMARDLTDGRIRWGGRGVINPFEPDGSLARLDRYPRFRAFLEQHREAIAARHCAKKSADGWYRTIDRIWPDLAARPKILIPDIKGELDATVDEGRLYPHHNLYWVTSEAWDLAALATVLRSSIAVMFVAAYSVKMAGGFLRFQAQYLRRIRVPAWGKVPLAVRKALIAAPPADPVAIDAAVFELYGLSRADHALVTEIAQAARVRRKG